MTVQELIGETCTSSRDAARDIPEKPIKIACSTAERDDPADLDSCNTSTIGISPRPCPDVSVLIPAGASVQLIRALRSLYDDDASSCSRLQWLTQPVLRSSGSGTSSRPSSAGRFGGALHARTGSSGPRRPARPSSARSGSSSSSIAKSQMAEDVEIGRQPATIGRRAVSPILSSCRVAASEDNGQLQRQRPWSASHNCQHQHGLDAPQRAALQTLAFLTELGEEREEARQLKQEKIRAWLQRKEAEVHEKRLAEEAKARLNSEEEEKRQQQRLAYEARMQKQKSCRLQAAARRRNKLANEVQRGETSTPRNIKAITCSTFSGALAAYATPRPISARSRKS